MNLVGEVASRLAQNCTLEEIEALEMIMRLKKGSEYGHSGQPQRPLPHPDHIDMRSLGSEGFSFTAKYGPDAVNDQVQVITYPNINANH